MRKPDAKKERDESSEDDSFSVADLPFFTTNTSKPMFTAKRELPMELSEEEGTLIIRVQLPGVKRDEIHIIVSDQGVGVIIERTSRIEQEDPEAGTYSRYSRYHGFYQHIPLPEDADRDQMLAYYDEDVLELRVPKKQEEYV